MLALRPGDRSAVDLLEQSRKGLKQQEMTELLEEATGIFFSGDVVFEGEILDELFSSNIEDYVETMRRLAELPVNVVHPGHYGSFGQERLVELVSTYVESKQAPVCPAEAANPA